MEVKDCLACLGRNIVRKLGSLWVRKACRVVWFRLQSQHHPRRQARGCVLIKSQTRLTNTCNTPRQASDCLYRIPVSRLRSYRIDYADTRSHGRESESWPGRKVRISLSHCPNLGSGFTPIEMRAVGAALLLFVGFLRMRRDAEA